MLQNVTLEDMVKLQNQVNEADNSLSEREWHGFMKEYERWLDKWEQETLLTSGLHFHGLQKF